MFRINVISGLLVLVGCASWAQAETQSPVTIVATRVGESTRVSPTIPVEERRLIINKAWQHLGRLVQRKADGGAKTLHRVGKDETWVEWKNLRIAAVIDGGVSNADLVRGVTRRYYCEIKCDAHRIWNPDTISWSVWTPGGYEPFPWRVEVAWEGGVWVARVDEHDGHFIAPGGGGRCSGEAGLFRVSTDGHEARVAMRY